MVRISENNSDKVTIEIQVKDMHPANVRLLKTLNTLLAQLVATTDEAEFFNHSAEVMRICASVIQQAKFPVMNKNEKIPYAHQALEFSVDQLQEQMVKAKVVNYDN